MTNHDQSEQVQVGDAQVHLTVIIITITVITYWDHIKQKKEALGCIKIHMQGWFLFREIVPICFLQWSMMNTPA